LIHAQRKPDLTIRELAVPLVLLAGLLVIVLRLWYLQVVIADVLVERASHTYMKISSPAPRGLVYDKEGTLLAGVRSELVVTVRPIAVKEEPTLLDRLAAILGVERAQLEEKVNAEAWRPYVPAPVYRGVSLDVASRIVELRSDLPGVDVTPTPMRFYPDSSTLAHILGYVWSANESDVARLRKLGVAAPKFVGKLGVEYSHETLLMGTIGQERIEVDAKGRPLRLVGRDSALPGAQVRLSVNLALQRYAMTALGGRKGAVVALDPRTGEVLAMVSAPTYDAGLFEGGISQAAYQALSNDPDKPFVNRAIRGLYSPGSTFKIVTTLAAVRAGVFDVSRPNTCPGYYQVGNRRVRCMGVHGSISFVRAFERSCNTYFIDLAMRAGIENLRATAFEVGLGHPTGIDLVGESGGIFPTDEWVKKWRPDGKWYPGDTANVAIGQGEVSATPLQMACVAALVANGGRSFRPHFVHSFTDPATHKDHETKPEVLADIAAPGVVWSSLRQAMGQVISSGTARSAAISGLSWGGKTGSTETRRDRKTHSWFVGFAPLNDPQIAVAVLVEDAGHGGEIAAPIARDVVRAYLQGIPEVVLPTDPPADAPVNSALTAARSAALVRQSSAEPRS